MKVNVKWNKQMFKDVEVDLDLPPEAFKAQLYSLTGVPVDRQKVMGKGGLLGDVEWGRVTFKDGMNVMLMGTADALPTVSASEAPQFIEDLPEEEQDAVDTREYGAGLVNLGNTCYMNACMQCLYAVTELKDALKANGRRGNSVTAQALQLFESMERGGTVQPAMFLTTLRQAVPQFDQIGSETGKGGMRIHAQQDAEECWTAVLNAMRSSLRHGDANTIRDLFGITLKTELKCLECDETVSETTDALNLKCNITADVNHITEGIKLGLVEDREMSSLTMERIALWQGSAKVSRLPPYLTIQSMRFYYKVSTQKKAKIMRKVTFPAQLDMFEYCTAELQDALKGPRAALQAIEDAAAHAKRASGKPCNAAEDAGTARAAQGGAEAGDDAEMTDAHDAVSHAGAATGRYDLIAVLSHKGRSPDSGHYVAWVKQGPDSWIQFDDDKLIPRHDTDILALCGGGEWHTAYMMLWRAQRVPADVDGADAQGDTS